MTKIGSHDVAHLTITIKKQTKSVHFAVTRTEITLKKNVFDIHTKCFRTHHNLCNTSPVLTLYNLALSFLLTAGHDTDGCRENGI